MSASPSAAVERITPERAREMVEAGNAVLVDIREPEELRQTGKAEGALAIPSGLLAFKADPEDSMVDPNFSTDKPVILYCAAGGRAARAGEMLKDMGYVHVFNMGGFKDWAAAGLPVEPAGE
ncbi:rhodanese-like domain-containing protein [Faunimonas pinastri]|nr:rhodanese-like domain-containing protein [Faunimonas pinastri]